MEKEKAKEIVKIKLGEVEERRKEIKTHSKIKIDRIKDNEKEELSEVDRAKKSLKELFNSIETAKGISKEISFDEIIKKDSDSDKSFFEKISDYFYAVLPVINDRKLELSKDDLSKKWIDEKIDRWRGNNTRYKFFIGRHLIRQYEYNERGEKIVNKDLFKFLRDTDVGHLIEGKNKNVKAEKIDNYKKFSKIIKDSGLEVENYDGYSYGELTESRKVKPKKIYRYSSYNGDLDEVEVSKIRVTELADVSFYREYKNDDGEKREDDFLRVSIKDDDLNSIKNISNVVDVLAVKEFENDIKELVNKLKERVKEREQQKDKILKEIYKEFGSKLVLNEI